MGVYTIENFKESAGINSSAINPIQNIIDIEEADHALFEAVIETDFLQAYNESNVICLEESELNMITEASIKGIKESIAKVWKKFVEFFKKITTVFFAKIDEIFKNDKGLIKRLSKFVVWDKVKDCPVKAKNGFVKYEEIDENCKNLKSDLTNQLGSILDNFSSDNKTINVNKEEIDSLCDKVEKYIEEKSKVLSEIKVSENPIISELGEEGFSNYIKSFEDGANSKYIKDVKENAKKDLDNYKKKEKELSAAAKSNSKNEDNKESDLHNADACVKKLIAAFNKIFNFELAVIKLLIKNQRSVYFAVGNWAVKNQDKTVGESAVLESAISDLVIMNSDAYVDEALDF